MGTPVAQPPVFRTTLNNGPTKFTLHCHLKSNGQQGELVNFDAFDPVASPDGWTMPDGVDGTQLTIMRIWYAMVWFDTLITFGGDEDVPTWTLARDCGDYIDFRSFGGLKDRVTAGATGRLLLTTNGFDPVGSQGTLIIEFTKN